MHLDSIPSTKENKEKQIQYAITSDLSTQFQISSFQYSWCFKSSLTNKKKKEKQMYNSNYGFIRKLFLLSNQRY